MKRIILSITMAATTLAINAQETYENATIVTEDLNGTARYVGMGGAMDALGADISTIGTNPAGIGLFRRSQIKTSFGVVSQKDAVEFSDAKKTRLSIDQAGFVYATRTGESSFVNFAFNYSKNRNFSRILSAANALNYASQNKQSYNKGADGIFEPYVTHDGYIDSRDNSFTQLDYLYYNTLLATPDDEGNPIYGYNEASAYRYNAYDKGYVGEYDFNLSGNIGDRLYLGLTVGVKSVHYTGYSEYSEVLLDDSGTAGTMLLSDERSITGTGFNIKIGAIFRPIETSPLRFGLSIATPTWYDLSSENYTVLHNNTDYGVNNYGQVNNKYDFKLSTPWKFGVSAGTTISNWMAVGAGLDYADYANLEPRVNDGDVYDWEMNSYFDESSTDRDMQRHTEKTLRGVTTAKVGVELRPDYDLAIRFGYNYVSPIYRKDGQKAYDNFSPAQYYTSTTAFTNWDAAQRLTCGIGYTWDDFTLDLAYQYSSQEGTFYPFNDVNGVDLEVSNRCQGTTVKDNRHQVLLTLGYSF